MRPVWFVVCFSLGVGLMIFSGYLPQSAEARGARGESVSGSGTPAGRLHDPFESITLRVPADYSSPPPRKPDKAPAAEVQPEPGNAEPTSADDRVPPAPQPLDHGPQKPAATPTPKPEQPADVSAPAADQPSAPAEVLPLADAGPDRVVWIGWDELTLDGSGSSGLGLSYQWKQLSGPVQLVIANDRQATTTARGLLNGEALSWRNITYKFELTVTDAGGQQDTDTVVYTVKSAPALTIKPPGERRFEVRDGYELAHYYSWVTNPDTLESVFEISSDNELTFTRVGGGASYLLSGGLEGKRYIYQVVLYARPEETSSWIEFLVDTDEKIPAIVQLGVNWESR